MRKYLILGLLALALLAIPAAVAAESKTTVITGSVTTSISLTVDDTALSLGTMDVGMNPASPGYVTTTVHVTTSGPIKGWTLTAADKGGLKTGWLLDGSTYLTNALGFAWGAEPWNDLTTTWTIASDSTYPFDPSDTPVFFRQEVVTGDPAGSYTMTVEFNGALT